MTIASDTSRHAGTPVAAATHVVAMLGDACRDAADVGALDSNHGLPVVVTSRRPGARLSSLLHARAAAIDAAVGQVGALLFRGFSVLGIDGFAVCAALACGDLTAYQDRGTPRTEVGPRVYSATDYPPPHRIFLHGEGAFAASWPRRLCFYCKTPAREGGETPLADARRVLDRIDAAVRERFARDGVLYVRNFGGAFGQSWQTVFQTTSPEELVRYCRAAGIAWEWVGADRLRTRQVRPAMLCHPGTGEWVWFNHAAALHVSTLAPRVRDMLVKMVGEAGLPTNSYYGDGAPIEADAIENVRRAYLDERVLVRWQPDDVVIVDNLLVAHGREPYAGPREVYVALARPSSWDAVAHTGVASLEDTGKGTA